MAGFKDIKQGNKDQGIGVNEFGNPLTPEEVYGDESSREDLIETQHVPANHGYAEDLSAHLSTLNFDLEEELKLAKNGEEGEPPMTLQELMSPMHPEDINAQREKADAQRKATEPEYKIQTHIFILGSDNEPSRYTKDGQEIPAPDYSKDRENYEKILTESARGDAVLFTHEVKDIQNTSRFKVYVEVGYADK